MKKTKVSFNAVKLDYSCELMRALAHPLRLQILEFIDKQGVVNVKQDLQCTQN
jgi:predicted transcriptional regulator